jgi:hypothetical protein
MVYVEQKRKYFFGNKLEPAAARFIHSLFICTQHFRGPRLRRDNRWLNEQVDETR